jgi:hypothetical protein
MTKQLACGQCGEVFADAFYRPWTGTLIIKSLTDDRRLTPLTPGFEFRLAQQRMTAGQGTEQAAARRRADFISRHVGERIYDLPCQRRHSNLATAPQIARALRRTEGRWVSLDSPPT